MMRLANTLTDTAALQELGSRLRQLRLDANVSQSALAAQTGLGRRTIQRLEDGEDVSVSTLIRVLRCHGLLERLDKLIVEPGINPLLLLELQQRGKTRRRASQRPAPPPKGDRRWGDEM